MKRLFYALIAVAATLSFAACNQEEDNVIGQQGENTLAFTVGAATRAAAELAQPVVTDVISVTDQADGQVFNFEETVVSLDSPEFFLPAETRGTPAYTENFLNLSGGKFQALAFPAEPMGGQKEWFSTFPRTSYGVANTNNFADFEKNGDFWEYSYQWDPWFDQETLLFYAKMVVNESTAFTGPALGQNIGVLRNSYEFIYDGTTPSMTFSYRSPLTAADQQDILFAARPVTKAESKKAVPILFYHALTGVKFATAYANDGNVKTYIKKVELTGLYGYGKCTVKSLAENGNYEDVTSVYSSADAVSWALSENNAASLTTVYSQEYGDASVTYETGGSFTSQGSYPDSFAAAGNKQNLNDGNASMTFWFPPQTITDALKATVTFEIEVNGTRTEYELDLDLGARLGSQTWKAGQLRTFTLKPDEVDVEIHDEVSGFEKTDVVITNTGNVDAYIRALIVANWWGTAGSEEGVAMGYTSTERTAFVTPWERVGLTGDNYGGVFQGLPGEDWKLASDGYFYYKVAVKPGDTTGTPLFVKYSLDTQAHPVPKIYFLDGTVQPYTNVHLRMEIPVQAIEAKAGSSWDAAWTEAVGYTVE